MIAASVATFFTMRMSMRQQTESSMANPSMANPHTAMIGKLMMYGAPVGMLVSGLFFPVPIAVLLYFLASNVWTLGQQHFLTNRGVLRQAHG